MSTLQVRALTQPWQSSEGVREAIKSLAVCAISAELTEADLNTPDDFFHLWHKIELPRGRNALLHLLPKIIYYLGEHVQNHINAWVAERSLIDFFDFLSQLADWSEDALWRRIQDAESKKTVVTTILDEIQRTASNIWYDFIPGPGCNYYISPVVFDSEPIARIFICYFGKPRQSGLPEKATDQKFLRVMRFIGDLITKHWSTSWQKDKLMHMSIVRALHLTRQLDWIVQDKFGSLIPALLELMKAIDASSAHLYPDWDFKNIQRFIHQCELREGCNPHVRHLINLIKIHHFPGPDKQDLV